MQISKENISQLLESAKEANQIAIEILDGERDMYDGADGARLMRDASQKIILLCEYILKRIEN